MHKPIIKLVIESQALTALNFSDETQAKDLTAAFIKHIETRFNAEIIWLGETPEQIYNQQIWPLGGKLPAFNKDTVVICQSEDLAQAARLDEALLVTVKHANSDDMAYNLQTAEDLAFLQKLLTPLNSGKIPNELLGGVLAEIQTDDPLLLINPGIGEDTAAIDISQAEVLVLKSDPITFASNAVSQYAVLVNANDIATAGARPRWFMSTLLFPRLTTGLAIRHIILELSRYCRKWDIMLAGGHTEITDSVTRPVVIGMMSGTVPRDKLLNKKDIKPGDVMVLTKAVAPEGTALIAKEMAPKLLAAGMTRAEINECARFLDMIAVLPEADIAMRHKGVMAMHDVTEGGLATAALEMAVAAGLGLSVDMASIPVFPATQKICDILKINPLGLISSGCLLIACQKESVQELLARLEKAGILATAIAVFTNENAGQATPTETGRQWPAFEVDEIARILQND